MTRSDFARTSRGRNHEGFEDCGTPFPALEGDTEKPAGGRPGQSGGDPDISQEREWPLPRDRRNPFPMPTATLVVFVGYGSGFDQYARDQDS